MYANEESDRDAAIYDFIIRYRQAHTFSPSIADIAVGTRLKTSTVRHRLDVLEAHGHIERDGSKSITPLRPPAGSKIAS